MGKKTEQITFWVSVEDLEVIKANAEKFKATSQSDYLRRLAVSGLNPYQIQESLKEQDIQSFEMRDFGGISQEQFQALERRLRQKKAG